MAIAMTIEESNMDKLATALGHYQGRPCKVPGCDGRVKQLGDYCLKHRHHYLKQGHPEQSALVPALYDDERTEVAGFLWSTQNAAYLNYFEKSLGLLSSWAATEIEKSERGKPQVKWHREAAHVIQRVLHRADQRDVIKRCVGMLIASIRRPHLIKDERALRVQLARAFMRTVGLENASGKRNGHLPSNTLLALGTVLVDALYYGARRLEPLMSQQKNAKVNLRRALDEHLGQTGLGEAQTTQEMEYG
jgi:hypothetical protein